MAKQGTDIEIARGANQFPISEIGAKLDIPGAGRYRHMGPTRLRSITAFSRILRTVRAAN